MAAEMAVALVGNYSEPRVGEPARVGIVGEQIRQASREWQQRRQECDVAVMRLLELKRELGARTIEGESASAAFPTLAGEIAARGIASLAVLPEHLASEQDDSAPVVARALPPGNQVTSITAVESFQRIDTVGHLACLTSSELGMPKATYPEQGKRQPPLKAPPLFMGN